MQIQLIPTLPLTGSLSGLENLPVKGNTNPISDEWTWILTQTLHVLLQPSSSFFTPFTVTAGSSLTAQSVYGARLLIPNIGF